ncbi:MAG: 50S ribosomal protein L10 [Pseudomonadota bacterium]
MRREEKVEQVKSLAKRVDKAKVMIFADYRGLKVSEMTELRSKLRDDGSSFKVIKNSLFKRVLKEMGLETLEKYFEGPTALATSEIDPVNPAKALVEFAKMHDKLTLKGGYLEGRDLTLADVQSLAKMPSRETLLARVLFSFNAPATNMASVLAAVPRKLLYALNAIKDTKEA